MADDQELMTAIDRRERVLDRIREMIIDQLHIRREPEELDPDTPLFGTGLRLDSIDGAELWINLSMEFGIAPANDMATRVTSLRTLNTLADLVLGLTEGRADVA